MGRAFARPLILPWTWILLGWWKNTFRCLSYKMSLLMVPSGIQSTVSRHSGATRKVFEPGRQGEEPQNYSLTPLTEALCQQS